jgi:hypothetical protein
MRQGFGPLRPFAFKPSMGRALARLPAARERFFITVARTLTKGIVSGQDSNGHGCSNSATCIRAGGGAATPGLPSRPAAIPRRGSDGWPATPLRFRWSGVFCSVAPPTVQEFLEGLTLQPFDVEAFIWITSTGVQ